MPKKLIEINKFTGGVVSTPSATDTDEQSAKYSSNIDPQTAEGRLQSIDNDKILKTTGFKSQSSTDTDFEISNGSGVVNYAREIIAVSDRKNSGHINLVIGKSDLIGTNVVNTISVIQNILSNSITEHIFDSTSQFGGDRSFVANDDKVFLVMG